VEAALPGTDERDLFAIDVSRDDLLRVTVWDYVRNATLSVELIDDAGEIMEVAQVEHDEVMRLVGIFPPGRYFIQVTRTAQTGAVDYKLTWDHPTQRTGTFGRRWLRPE
jgi:hypothetical protein